MAAGGFNDLAQLGLGKVIGSPGDKKSSTHQHVSCDLDKYNYVKNYQGLTFPTKTKRLFLLQSFPSPAQSPALHAEPTSSAERGPQDATATPSLASYEYIQHLPFHAGWIIKITFLLLSK